MGTDLVKVPLKWYEFRQNNSGGRFHYDENVGKHVYIQATSAEEANARAESIGIYFNGCEDGRDCDWCGDRWYSQWMNDEGSEEFPKIGMFIRDKGWQEREYALMDTVPSAPGSFYDVFHFYDGTRQYGVPQLIDDEVDTSVY